MARQGRVAQRVGCVWLAVLQVFLIDPAVGINAKANTQFDAMLHSVSLTPAALACVDKPRVRTILIGVDALMEEPTVRAAFQTIYEDFRLLRPAGDLAVRQLALQCQAARERANKLASLIGEEARADALLPTLRRYFEAIDLSGSGRLNKAELQAACGGSAGSSVAALAAACLREECELEEATSEPTFADFVMVAARQQLDLEFLSSIVDDECLAEVEEQALRASREAPGARHAAHFDAMIARVGDWEESSEAVRRALEGEGRQGRLGLILRGCLDGARNDKLKQALRTVYCDDNVLRAAGDIIFKLLQTAVGDERKVEVMTTTTQAASAQSSPSGSRVPTATAIVDEVTGDAAPPDDSATRTTPSSQTRGEGASKAAEEDPSGLIAASQAIDVASDWEWAVEYLSKGF